jgi:hypothetical protein
MKPVISAVHESKVGALLKGACLAVHSEAALGAVADAGLLLVNIGGFITTYSFTSPQIMLGA